MPVLLRSLLLGLLVLLAACAKGRYATWEGDDSGGVSGDALVDQAPWLEGGVTRLDLSGDMPCVDADPDSPDGLPPDGPPADVTPADGCTAECAGKCAGDDDGCGQLCPVNQCLGCCKGLVCKTGSSTDACGAAGGTCKDCTFSSNCKVGACVSGACATQNRPDGISCPNGRCFGGMCCTGCWDGGTCRGGISGQYCGQKGVACSTCQASNPCKTASCASGYCVTGQRPFGHGCPGGKCLHGNCCTGCISNSVCHPGNTNGNCGNWGGPCQNCWSPKWCNGGNCTR